MVKQPHPLLYDNLYFSRVQTTFKLYSTVIFMITYYHSVSNACNKELVIHCKNKLVVLTSGWLSSLQTN